MNWKKPTFNGYKEKIQNIKEKLEEVNKIQIEEIMGKLTQIKDINEDLKKIKQFKNEDKSNFKARII